MKKLVVGILAHVDAGKTTLSEAMLYTGGSIGKLGRVDKGDAFLDTYDLEKKRGITIFSKQAILQWKDMWITLLDTPGHVDFSAEMERTLQVLDYAILVISGSDGVQGHTRTLWRLLARYQIPCFLFINKMDLAAERKGEMLEELKKCLDENCVDFGPDGCADFYENIAVCGEASLEQFLDTGCVDTKLIRNMIAEREVYPCFFGSALKLDGVNQFMSGMESYMMYPEYPDQFGAKVFKIARDTQGNRLTYLKITGGCLKVRDLIKDEKVNQIRLYSGEKYEAVGVVGAGCVCAVTGLTETEPGEGLGCDEASLLPVLEPVLTYRLCLPEGVDAAAMLPKFRQLEEEEPELHIAWKEAEKEIHIQVMGEIQMEILKSLFAERLGVDVGFGDRSIVYKETIRDTVEGVGHFEPLKHYAEVHLLLEPGEPGSGLQFATACGEDVLERNWQRLVLAHLEEKEHRGVLTGAAVTDMKITLMSGRAHKKHTVGGDFRQAVYRAVRQGLRQAESVLLEPYYEFRLEVPVPMIGRGMADVERMCGTFEPPIVEPPHSRSAECQAVLTGTAPVARMDGYQKEVTSYTSGTGRLICTLKGYGPCHNAQEIISKASYDPEGDIDNPTSSVFCSHGVGFVVNWDEVRDYMHLESCLASEKEQDQTMSGRQPARSQKEEEWIGTDEVDAILARTFYANRRDKTLPRKRRWGNTGHGNTDGTSVSTSAAGISRKVKSKEEYLLVDGYNIIFAWEELRELAELNIDSARGKLLDILCNYQGIRSCHIMVVFDAYRVQGHVTECFNYQNICVVYTREAETADQYIEKFAHNNGSKYQITVATSDRLEQIIILGQNCLPISARELLEEIRRANEGLHREIEEMKTGGKHYLLDGVSDETRREMQELPEGEGHTAD